MERSRKRYVREKEMTGISDGGREGGEVKIKLERKGDKSGEER